MVVITVEPSQNNVSYTPDIIATSNYGRITGSNTGTLTDNYGYVDTPA